MLPSNPKISQDDIRALHQGAWRWTLSLMSDPQAAEDVLQEVYSMVIDGRARFDGRSTLKTWLYAVIRNTAHKENRKNQRRKLQQHSLELVETSEQAISQTTPEQGQTYDIDQRNQRIAGAMAKLPQRQREILELVIYREFTLAECANILGIGLGSVRTHYQRGKESLRKSLADQL